MTIPVITTVVPALPAAPQRSDPSTFETRSDAWLDAVETELEPALNALATEINAASAAIDAVIATIDADAAAAAASESAAAASASAAASSSGAPMWVSGTTYALGDAVWSPYNRFVYRRIVAGAGTTDPSSDPANWSTVGVVGLTVVTVSGTSQTAVAGAHYVLTNVAATTVTLPASPASGDTVAITPANSLVTNVIARGGNTIMSLAEDMTLDNANATVTLRYLASTWRII